MRFRTLLTTASALALGVGMMAGSAQSNQLMVDQIGNKNFADATQKGNGNETFARSEGDRNTVSVPITGNGIVNDVLVKQTGDLNDAEYRGDGKDLTRNDVAILQNGNRNTAAFAPFSGNTRNNLAVIQDGFRNEVSGGQTSSNANRGDPAASSPQLGLTLTSFSDGGSAIAANPEADAPISGNRNFAAFEQLGNRNVAAVKVDGNGNTIQGQAVPFGSFNSTEVELNPQAGGSFFESDGGNGVAANEPNLSSTEDFYASGFALQEGDGNQMALTQAGDGNVIAASQTGNGNVQEVTQVGNNNLASTGQFD